MVMSKRGEVYQTIMMMLIKTEEHSMLMMVTLFLVKKVVVKELFVFELTKDLVP